MIPVSVKQSGQRDPNGRIVQCRIRKDQYMAMWSVANALGYPSMNKWVQEAVLEKLKVELENIQQGLTA